MTQTLTSGARSKPEPAVSKELITWLETTYPDRALGIDLPPREADARFGEIRLVRKLRDLHDRQHKSVLGKS